MIKKKKFLEKDSVADMMELLGEELDMEAEFNDLDNENTEKVQGYLYAPWIPDFGVSSYSIQRSQFMLSQVMFSEIISWAFKKTMRKNIAAKK